MTLNENCRKPDSHRDSSANVPANLAMMVNFGSYGAGFHEFIAALQGAVQSGPLTGCIALRAEGRPLPLPDLASAANSVPTGALFGFVYVHALEFGPEVQGSILLASIFDANLIVVVGGRSDEVDAARLAETSEAIASCVARSGKADPIIATVAFTFDGLRWNPGEVVSEVLRLLSCSRMRDSFRMVIDEVDRRSDNEISISGVIAGGVTQRGNRLAIVPGGAIGSVVEFDPLPANDSAKRRAKIVLDRVGPVKPGDLACDAVDRPSVADQVAAHVLWFDKHPMLPGRSYEFQLAGQRTKGFISTLKHRVALDFNRLAAKQLNIGEIGFCNVVLGEAILFEPRSSNAMLGSATIFDQLEQRPVGVALFRFGLWRATNVHWQALDIDKAARRRIKGHDAFCLWFTGLSGSGKSTIVNLLEKRLNVDDCHTYVLDGDNVRHGLNRDLGFTDADRVENIRRVSEVARLLVDAGLIVMVSFISPFRNERRMARELIGQAEFMEIFVDAPLDVCEERDPKGLYKKARMGQIKNFTGIDSAYEVPQDPDLRLDTSSHDPASLVNQIYDVLLRRGVLSFRGP